MSVQENKEFIRKYLEDISGKPKPAELLQKYMTDQDLIDHILASEIAIPNYRIEIEEMIAEGDLVSVRARTRGFHNGPLGGIPPTGKEVNLPFFITYHVIDGKIVDHWMTRDNTALFQQLGISQLEGTDA